MKIGQLDTSKIVITDFETYFDDDYSLRKMRNEEYILDPRWKCHGVATADHKGRVDWIESRDIPKWLRAHKHHTVVNHKLTFDALIWKLRYNHVFPLMVDTLFLANAIQGPAEVSGGNSLEEVSERLGFQPKGKIDMFKGKRELNTEEAAAMRLYATNDADLTYKCFQALLPQLTRPEFELWLLDHTLRIYLEKPLPVNAPVCSATIKKVQKKVAEAISTLPPIKFDYTIYKNRQKKGVKYKDPIELKLTLNEEVLASNPQFGKALLSVLKKEKIKIPMKMGKNGEIPALAKADEGFAALRDCKSKVVRDLVNARLVKRSGDTQVARLRSLLLCHAAGGFRVYLNYWGAGTGRWSGGSGLNAHNFPNPTRSTDPFEREVAGLIRECVLAPKGKVFTAVDAANIEARVLAWWAGQQDLVDAFGEGSDVYSEFAEKEIFKEEVRKPTKQDIPAVVIRLKLLRAVGKIAVLGLGYSMGNTPQPGKQYGKFEGSLRSSPDVRPLFESGELDKSRCDAIVKAYRARYPRIPELWNKVEAAFLAARTGKQRAVNGVLFTCKGKTVSIILPSGRTIQYLNVRQVNLGKGGAYGSSGLQWVYGHGQGKKLYGGLLVENVVQAVSRDILAEGVWAMEQEGYPVAYHVHDSIVAAVPKKEAEKGLKFCIDTLSASPEWAKGMRLGAEGEITGVFA